MPETYAKDKLREYFRASMRNQTPEVLAGIVEDVSAVWAERHGPDGTLIMLLLGWLKGEIAKESPYRELRGRLLSAVDVAMLEVQSVGPRKVPPDVTAEHQWAAYDAAQARAVAMGGAPAMLPPPSVPRPER